MKPKILPWILIVGSLAGCQTRKNTIFLEQTWNRDYAKNACQMYKHSYNSACIKTPEQMATELKLRFESAVRQSPACKLVTISYTPVGQEDMKDYLRGWSLTFDVEIEARDIDYSHSVWSMLDNKTKRRIEGPFTDAVEATTQICILATRRGSSVSE